jgi:hypothetical protein
MKFEIMRQNAQFIDIGVEYAVHESNAGALVGVLVRELDMNFPEAALEGCCDVSVSLCFSAPSITHSLLAP